MPVSTFSGITNHGFNKKEILNSYFLNMSSTRFLCFGRDCPAHATVEPAEARALLERVREAMHEYAEESRGVCPHCGAGSNWRVMKFSEAMRSIVPDVTVDDLEHLAWLADEFAHEDDEGTSGIEIRATGLVAPARLGEVPVVSIGDSVEDAKRFYKEAMDRYCYETSVTAAEERGKKSLEKLQEKFPGLKI